MSKNFTEINSVRKFVDFSKGNDFKQEIFQNVDFKNPSNSQHLQMLSNQEFPALSQEKKLVKIEYFAQNNNDNNSNQTSSIRQEIYDSTLFILPKISAHYAVKNLQELQEIDEVNRKLLGIEDELNYKNNESNQPPLNHVYQDLEGDSNNSFIESLIKKEDQVFDNPATSVKISSDIKKAESLVRKLRILSN
jgi:hypothetical protein